MSTNALSEFLDMDEIIDQYKFNSKIQSELRKLKVIFPRFRRVRGDGNCFYRAFFFYYLQFILYHDNSGILIDRLIKQIESLDFATVCSPDSLVDTLLNIKIASFLNKSKFIDALKALQSSARNLFNSYGSSLHDAFNMNATLDYCSIITVRGLIDQKFDQFIQKERYQGYSTDYDKYQLRKSIQTFGVEAEGIMIAFAAEIFEVQLTYYSLKQQNNEFYTIIYPESSTDYQIMFNLPLFFRPGHYDVCYESKWPDCPHQINVTQPTEPIKPPSFPPISPPEDSSQEAMLKYIEELRKKLEQQENQHKKEVQNYKRLISQIEKEKNAEIRSFKEKYQQAESENKFLKEQIENMKKKADTNNDFNLRDPKENPFKINNNHHYQNFFSDLTNSQQLSLESFWGQTFSQITDKKMYETEQIEIKKVYFKNELFNQRENGDFYVLFDTTRLFKSDFPLSIFKINGKAFLIQRDQQTVIQPCEVQCSQVEQFLSLHDKQKILISLKSLQPKQPNEFSYYELNIQTESDKFCHLFTEYEIVIHSILFKNQ